jgi:hypothetical protein
MRNLPAKLLLLCVVVSAPCSAVQDGSGPASAAPGVASQAITATNPFGIRVPPAAPGAIALTIKECGNSNPCVIWIPAHYPPLEAVPGSNLASQQDGASTSGNISIRDFRYGVYDTAVDPQGSRPQSNYRAWKDWSVNYYRSPIARGTNEVLLNTVHNSFDGGANWLQNGYLDKTNWLAFDHRMNSFTPGQHIGVSYLNNNFSLGDSLLVQGTNFCWGGYVAGGDEGCEAADWEVFQGGVEYAGLVTGGASPGATSLTIRPTQGAGTQGAGRFLIDMNPRKTISVGSISAVSSRGDDLTVVSGTNTAWAVSTILARLGSAIAAPSTTSTVKPDSFARGSISDISPSKLLCVADGGAFEMLYPRSVDASAGSFTATFAKPHSPSAVIASGGVCGYLFDFAADDVTDSTFPSKIHKITGTLHFGWPAVASVSPGTALIWIAGLGTYQSYPGNWGPSHAGYTMYPMAEVISVQQDGTVSNALKLSPNNGKWADGDLAEETMYPAVHVTMGNFVLEKYYPHFSDAAGFGYNLSLNGLWSGNDSAFRVSNHTPASFYSGGQLTPPVVLNLTGQYAFGMKLDRPPANATVAVQCAASGCNSEATALQMFNAQGFDLLSYDESRERYRFTAGNRAADFYLDPKNGLIAPAVDIGSETFTAAPRAVYPTFLPGPLTSEWVGSTFTPDHGLIVTRLQVQLKTAPVACRVNATVAVGDQAGQGVTVTIRHAANDSGVTGQVFAAGSPLAVTVSRAAGGCATNPADANVIVQYRLQ